MSFYQLLFLLFCAHALGDFALQNDFTATNKNRHVRRNYTEAQQKKMEIIWPWLMTAHAMHHGFLVYFVTQNVTVGILETVFHWVIDFGKCERWYNFHTDQFLHLGNKVVWAYLLYNQLI